MTQHERIPALIDEAPLLVLPSLAKVLGITDAVIIQQLHFLLMVARKSRNQYVFVDQKWWVYNTYAEWSEIFPWLSEVTIKRCMTDLERKQLIESRQGVKDKFDRRKWYTINYDKLHEIVNLVSSIRSKRSDGTNHNDPDYNGSKRSDDYMNTETTSETTTENIADPDGSEGTPPLQDNTSLHVKQTTQPPETVANVEPKRETVPAAQMNPMKDAIAEVFGWDWKTMTKKEIGNIQRTAKELCLAGYTPEDARAIHAYCKAQNFTSFSPAALSAHASAWRTTVRPVVQSEPAPAPLPEDEVAPELRQTLHFVKCWNNDDDYSEATRKELYANGLLFKGFRQEALQALGYRLDETTIRFVRVSA